MTKKTFLRNVFIRNYVTVGSVLMSSCLLFSNGVQRQKSNVEIIHLFKRQSVSRYALIKESLSVGPLSSTDRRININLIFTFHLLSG